MPVNFLDHLTAEQREMIVSLPYRVGMSINKSDEDDDGEDHSDEQQAELQALYNLLNAFSQDVFGAETVTYVISETVRRKDEWPKWADQTDNIEDDCQRAIDILSGMVDPKEVNAFRNYLVEVGESVAMAFCEYNENTPFFEKLKMKMAYSKCRAKAEKLQRDFKNFEEFISISLSERKTLEGIAKALGVVYV